MPEHQERQLDSRQLRILLTLLEQQSVTHTAEVLNQSQPYVSLVLKRLRATIGDPLLVRSGSKLVPTERAIELLEPLRATIAGIEQIISPPDRFDPAIASCTFRVASADCMEAFFLPRLIAAIRDAAPSARLQLRSIGAEFDYVTALEQGELDAVIGNWPSPPENLKTVKLFADDIVCVFKRDHQFAGRNRLLMEQYLEADHVAPMPSSLSTEGPIDGQLTKLGLKRNITVTVPEFNVVPYVLLKTDLVFTSCRHFADHYSSSLPIASSNAPLEFGEMRFYLLWHQRSHASAANKWLRSQIVSVAKSLTDVQDDTAVP